MPGWPVVTIAEEVARLKEQPDKDLAVGGAGLAAVFIELGLIDEYGLFVSPVVLVGGAPYFPALDKKIDLELVGDEDIWLARRLPPLPEHYSGCRCSTLTCRRATISERWQASGSRSTQSRVAELSPIHLTTGPRSTCSRISSV